MSAKNKFYFCFFVNVWCYCLICILIVHLCRVCVWGGVSIMYSHQLGCLHYLSPQIFTRSLWRECLWFSLKILWRMLPRTFLVSWSHRCHSAALWPPSSPMRCLLVTWMLLLWGVWLSSECSRIWMSSYCGSTDLQTTLSSLSPSSHSPPLQFI